MAGSRKFSVEHISRSNLATLSREASDINRVPYVMDVDRDGADAILSALQDDKASRKSHRGSIFRKHC